jgi:hypothetical protein
MTVILAPDSARAEVLKLLAQGEHADFTERGTTANTLPNGDEYLDLDQLVRGVQRARAGVPIGSHVVPRKAIHEDTWRRILRRLAAMLG